MRETEKEGGETEGYTSSCRVLHSERELDLKLNHHQDCATRNRGILSHSRNKETSAAFTDNSL